jgi:hypothetical protein
MRGHGDDGVEVMGVMQNLPDTTERHGDPDIDVLGAPRAVYEPKLPGQYALQSRRATYVVVVSMIITWKLEKTGDSP